MLLVKRYRAHEENSNCDQNKWLRHHSTLCPIFEGVPYWPNSIGQQNSESYATVQHQFLFIYISFALQLHAKSMDSQLSDTHSHIGQMVTVYAYWKRKIDVMWVRMRKMSQTEENEELPFQLLFCIVWLPRELNHGRVIRRYRMAQLRERCQNTR